jgi:hypothetical protein
VHPCAAAPVPATAANVKRASGSPTTASLIQMAPGEDSLRLRRKITARDDDFPANLLAISAFHLIPLAPDLLSTAPQDTIRIRNRRLYPRWKR